MRADIASRTPVRLTLRPTDCTPTAAITYVPDLREDCILRRIVIEGLFGLYDHRITLREKPPVTIVAGPNGIGKTTLLRLTNALLRGAYSELTRPAFSRLAVAAASGAELSVERDHDATDPAVVPLRLRLAKPGTEPRSATIDVPTEAPLPSYIERVGANMYIDVRDGEELDERDLVERYAYEEPDLSPPEWFAPQDWRTDFIETRRLDVLSTPRVPRFRPRRPSMRSRAPIYNYLEAVSEELERARAESARIRQSRDRTLAQRLLTRGGRLTVNVDKLRQRYASVEERASVLTSNGLLSESLDVLPREDMNPTEKRILNLFLDDFEAKLAPLERQSARLNELRNIIDRKFINKSFYIDSREGITFRAAPSDTPIPAESLSSGEQHELALICRLLFNEEAGTTVLIDEPELSLHVSWQHEMLTDLAEIAELAHLSFVLATHSTAIINGRWDLVEELGPIDNDDHR